MAEFAVINGAVLAPSEQIGRDVLFLTFQADNTLLQAALPDVNGVTPSLTNLDLLRKIIDNAATVTMVGAVTGGGDGDDITFMVEGLGFNDGSTDPMTLQAEINEIRDQVEALNGSALGTVICTISTLAGALLTPVVTDT